jgi:hypothetical protein
MEAIRVQPTPIEEHFVVHWDQPLFANVPAERNVVFHASRVGETEIAPRFVAKFVPDREARNRREIEVICVNNDLIIDCR